MIKEFEFFHGVVFARILHGTQRALSIKPFQSVSNASYVVNNTIGIYIKHSAKRMTPWNFTFKKEHKDEIDLMKSSFKNVFLILVCNDDGVVCLSYSELKEILDNQHDPIEWISATRHKREMYSVKGSNGKLDFKIGQNDFPEKIFRD
jgi:hypothetical protein